MVLVLVLVLDGSSIFEIYVSCYMDLWDYDIWIYIYIYVFFFFLSMHVYSIYMVRNICLTISNLKFHHMINMIIYIYNFSGQIW